MKNLLAAILVVAFSIAAFAVQPKLDAKQNEQKEENAENKGEETNKEIKGSKELNQ